jgi:hypothetical protein
MKKVIFTFYLLAAALFMTGSALSYTLTENFTGATIYQSDLTTTTGLNQWNDLIRWQINPTGGNTGAWAQQTPPPSGGENSLLFYGFSAAGLGAGTPFSLSFDYINGTNTYAGAAYVGGLDAGELISRFAPWPNLSTTYFDKYNIAQNSASTFTPVTVNGVVDADHLVLYIAFDMGGTTGLRGIDNVNLQVGAVPEPATLLFLGAGLIAIAGYGRKKLH